MEGRAAMIPTLALTAALTIAPAPPVDRDVPPSRAEVSRVVELASLPAARWRAFAACIVQRESHGNPRAVNPTSGASGIAQWMPAREHGLSYVVARGLKAHGASRAYARSVRLSLANVPIRRWPITYQRVALAQNLAEGQAAHWFLRGSRCNALGGI